jgi:hypothetical protein
MDEGLTFLGLSEENNGYHSPSPRLAAWYAKPSHALLMLHEAKV